MWCSTVLPPPFFLSCLSLLFVIQSLAKHRRISSAHWILAMLLCHMFGHVLCMVSRTLRCFVLYWRHRLHTNLHWRRLNIMRRSRWSRGPNRGSAAACLLGLWVRIPPGAWIFISCECCMLSGRGLCVGLITRPEESYWVWCVWVWSWILDNEEALAH